MTTRTRRDAGVSLIELLVAMSLLGVLSAVVVGFMTNASHNATENQQRVVITTSIDDANLRLGKDITEATSLRTAEAQRLVVTVVRNSKCQVIDWHVDAAAKALSTTTTTYEGKTCSGASTTGTKAVLRRYVQSATFSYWGESSTTPIPAPVDDTREVKRVAWELAAAPYEKVAAPPITMASSAVYTGRGQHDGTGTQTVQAKAPLLSVVTPREGVDQPRLSWVDPTPAVTNGWVVARASGPEDGKDQPYQPVAWLDKGTTSWTDTGLQPGYRGTYLILATLSDGSQGPSSNAVDTGLRPPQTLGVTAAGLPTSIKVDWTATVGATGYDVYRDGLLVANVGRVTSWTDTLTYGHSHTYQVVGVNLWESIAATGDLHARVPAGHKVDDPLRSVKRLASAASGAFTAPAAPSVTATPTGTAAGAVYQTTVTWAPAAWTGAGPTAGRDATWDTQFANDAGTPTFTDLWVGTASSTPTQVHTGRTPGATDRYQLRTCNAIGCSPWSPAAASLQRPPAPASCTTSAVSTRGMQVTVNPASAPSAPTAYTVAHAGGDGPANGAGTQASPVFAIDALAHSQTHTWNTTANNPSGASPVTSCTGTTAPLGVAITGTSSSTRTINASMSTVNGNASSLTLENVRTDTNVPSASWDPLPDGTGFTVTARNSDGYNDVVAQQAVSTAVLAAPGAPTCKVSVTDSEEPGAITVSGGDQVKLGSGGGAYGSPRGYSGLGAGTYTGYARATASDGYNTAYSGWDPCGGVTISDPPPTIPAGCATTSISQSPSPGVAWVFLNVCSDLSAKITNGVFTAEFQGRSYDLKNQAGQWLDAKYGSHQGKVSASTDIVSKVDIRVRLTRVSDGYVGGWTTVSTPIG